MTKGGKRYANMDQDGKWFAHVGSQQHEVTREACTTTGAMLSQAMPQHVQRQERFPKAFIDHEKKTMGRSYPLSKHDNRAALQDDINTYAHGLGRKKCLDDRREHNSHFCLCHDGSVSAGCVGSRDHSAHQTLLQPQQDTELTGRRRRFPRNHAARSQAAVAQAEESYMWFGRHDINHCTPLSVLAATNHSSASEQK